MPVDLENRVIAGQEYKAYAEVKMIGSSSHALDMNWKKIVLSSLVCAALTVWGYLYLDTRLAEFVSEKLGSGFVNSSVVSNMPDLLFLLVCTIAVVSWSARFWLSLKYSDHWSLNFLELIGWAVPLAFILKHLLKRLFGQTETRIWLVHPDQFGFHWFQGGGDFSGFPSGHMAVLTALMLGISRYFPRLRPVCAGLLLLLALALIVTQYHFFSDIVAGVYVGLLVDVLTCRGLSLFRRYREEPAAGL